MSNDLNIVTINLSEIDDTFQGQEFFDIELAVAALLSSNKMFCNTRRPAGFRYDKETKQWEDDGELGFPTIVLYVLLNDVFAWACADSEHITVDEVPDLFRMWYKDRTWGVVRWGCIKRNEQPQDPMKRDMIRDGSWDETLEILPENKYDTICREEYEKRKANEQPTIS